MNFINLIFNSQTYGRDTVKKIFLFTAIMWFPLVLISFISGTLFSFDKSIKIPFLYDLLTNARFLISFPLIFFSIKIINNLISKSFDHFLSTEIIFKDDQGKFKQISDSFYKFKDSNLSNTIILIFSYFWTFYFWRDTEDISGINTWRFFGANDLGLQPVGYWYYIISIPFYQFFLFKMIWTFFIWSFSLLRISRLKLNLSSSSPDGAGGLAFLGYTQISFGLLGFAQNVTLSAGIANLIKYNNESFLDYRYNIITGILVFSLVYISPLMFFSKQMFKTKMLTLFEYSKLGLVYGTSFENKWIKKKLPQTEEPFLGTADIQSLADLSNSVKMVQDQLIFPLRLTTFIVFFVFLLIPYLPLLLFRFTSQEIFEAIIKLFTG